MKKLINNNKVMSFVLRTFRTAFQLVRNHCHSREGSPMKNAMFIAALFATVIMSGTARAELFGGLSQPFVDQTAQNGPLIDSLLIPGISESRYQVDYGAIRAYGKIEGVETESSGTSVRPFAGFSDEVTITSPGIGIGDSGTLRARIDISGLMTSTDNGSGNYSFRLGLDGGPNFYTHHLGGRQFAYLGQDIIGDDFGSYEFELQFAYGVPRYLNMELIVTGDVTRGSAEDGSDVTGTMLADLSNTARWGGVVGLFDIDGNPVNSFVIESASGYDYKTLQSAVVPVPAAVWLFGSGLLGLIGVARRQRAGKMV